MSSVFLQPLEVILLYTVCIRTRNGTHFPGLLSMITKVSTSMPCREMLMMPFHSGIERRLN